MANELQIQVGASFSKGNLKEAVNSGTINVNVSGSKIERNTITVATSAATLSLGGVTTAGYVVLQNLDPTNYITISPDGTNDLIKLKAGEWCLFRSAGNTIEAKANTASCLLSYLIIED